MVTCGGRRSAARERTNQTVLPMSDGLLKLKDFPAEIGGSGETLPEWLSSDYRRLELRAKRSLAAIDFYSTPIPISNPSLNTDGLMVKNNTTPFTGETISSRVSPNKSPTVPICSPSLTASPCATFGYQTPVLFV